MNLVCEVGEKKMRTETVFATVTEKFRDKNGKSHMTLQPEGRDAAPLTILNTGLDHSEAEQADSAFYNVCKESGALLTTSEIIANIAGKTSPQQSDMSSIFTRSVKGKVTNVEYPRHSRSLFADISVDGDHSVTTGLLNDPKEKDQVNLYYSVKGDNLITARKDDTVNKTQASPTPDMAA